MVAIINYWARVIGALDFCELIHYNSTVSTSGAHTTLSHFRECMVCDLIQAGEAIITMGAPQLSRAVQQSSALASSRRYILQLQQPRDCYTF